MHLDPSALLAAAVVGFGVGLTGVGGGALMTPVLVLLLHVQPGPAVASDLVASFFMKPLGGAVHLRRGSVHMGLVKWLVAGAAPSAVAGTAALHFFVAGKALQQDIKLGLGAAILAAVAGLALRVVFGPRGPAAGQQSAGPAQPAVRIGPTLVVGAVGGFIVGMTSVGSGSLMMVALMMLYPGLNSRQLVGTDLVQSVPLVGAAALGQLIFGDVKFGLTVSLVVGSIPFVYLGARLSSAAPSGLLRGAISVVLLGTGLKLVGAPDVLLLAMVIAASALATIAFGAMKLARQRGVVTGRIEDRSGSPPRQGASTDRGPRQARRPQTTSA